MEAHGEPQLGSLLPHSMEANPDVTFEKNIVSVLEFSWLVEDNYVLKEGSFNWLDCLPQEVTLF